MKCIRCGTDSKYKERSGRRCPHCHKPFAFERGEAFTDQAFQRAIDAVSGEGRLKWGVEHLYYELCRRKRRSVGRRPLGCGVAAGVAACVLALVALASRTPVPAFLAAVAGVAAVAFFRRHLSQTVPLPREEFEPIFNHWLAIHGEPGGRIVRRPTPTGRRPAEADLGDYSFDRAVICDRARTVDLLLANNFHFENNCAVLSIAGYPAGPFETVRAMLRRNPKLQVFALHDASPEGCRMAQRLASDPAWFHGQAQVADVGLRPAQRGPFRGLFLPASAGHVVPGEGLTTAEASWLGSYTLELAAIRPEQVLKRLFRALSRKADRDETSSAGDGGAGSGSDVDYDADSFASDASDWDAGTDSFG